MKKTYGALVVGGGVAGIRAALDLAEAGHKVALVERRPNLGGLLTQLDHQFPTDACGMCKMLPLTEREDSSQFCMRKGLFHRNIDIHLNSELTELEGDPGSFQIRLRQRSTFVDPHKCIGCGVCTTVCPVKVPSEFNAGLTTRTAVHLPVPHAIPNHYVVDLDACQRCWNCFEACPTGAIDFKLDQRAGFRILVADADAETLDSLSDWLRKQSYSLHAAADTDAALEMMSGGDMMGVQGDDSWLLIMDMALPGAGPERVLARVQELSLPVTVVLMASDPEQREQAEALVAKGARAVFDKPFDPKVLGPWLDKLCMRVMSDTTLEMEAASVILAGGFDCFRPTQDVHGVGDVLGYGQLPGVITSLEFERMMSGTGPANKALKRADGKPVRRIGWLQCVGSRDAKRGAPWCSSICCMISVKEALLARKLTTRQQGEPAQCAIYYMDMRTFGREYERYRSDAEAEGVRFVRTRIHTVFPDQDDPGAVRVRYLTDDGQAVEETLDLFVLAVGARPPEGTARLAEVAGVDLNEDGWVATRPFAPTRTSRLGVFAAGAFGAPRDIAETVINAGAAALGAAKVISLYAPLVTQEKEPEPEFRDVSRDTPRLMVALCTSCPILEGRLDIDELRERLSRLPAAVAVENVEGACTAEGWKRVRELAAATSPNRILIGACQPYAYVPKLRELGAAIGLRPAFMDVADVYTAASALGKDATDEERGTVATEVVSILSMAASKLLKADGVESPHGQPVTQTSLVVGGGLAGMTAALGVADNGFDVTLVERSEALGGQAMRLHYTLDGEDPRRFMEELVERVEKHPRIDVRTDSRVVLSMGRAGRFASVLYSDDGGAATLEHGATILATGGHEAKVYDYGFKVSPSVLSQRDLEDGLASGAIDASALKGVAMIQCWRSRQEGRNYCSRVCCAGALKNIHMLKDRNPDLPIYVFYRDIMSYGFSERYYTEARRKGAIFIRYDPEHHPKVEFDETDKPVVTALDPILGAEVRVPVDILVLSTGVEPNDVSDLAEMFGVPLTVDGFFQEAETKWRPVDFLKQGVFACGLGKGPSNMGETVASARAAASRALRILSRTELAMDTMVAEVRHSLCSLCGRCIDVCPYGARSMDMVHDRIVVDEVLCQGCGSCAAVCPNSASVLRGFRDQQVLSSIDAALEGLVHVNQGDR